MAQLTLSERIAAGRGERPADLILKNLRLVNVLTGEIYPTEIVIAGGYVVALGSGYSAAQEIDLGGRYVCPGFIDAHVHIESSLCAPPEFMRTVVPRGTTSVVTDPHEIANVLGLEGIRYMLDRARFGIGRVFLMASSCVPASHMETSGATLLAEDLVQLLDDPRVLGLAEVMSYPDVIHADPVVMAKIQAFAGRVIDGHSPAVTGQALNAYVTAGIMSDHECTTPEEALEKLRLGMHILIREGTTTRNLRPLLPMVTAENHHRLCFCTDDRQPGTLLDEGSIDSMVRTAIAEGLDPMMAIRMGSINTANYFRLHDLGAIVPGRRADMIVFSDLRNLQPEMVFSDGVQVGENGRALAEAVSLPPLAVSASMNIRPGALDFTIPANGTKVHVIGGLDDQVVTEHFIDDARIVDGQAVADPDRDLLKIAVIERHTGSGRIGKGFIRGYGLKRGAIAGTVAHDHHNLVVIGADDASMEAAARAVIEMGGGLSAANGDQVLGTLPLPVGGLMTEIPLTEVRGAYDSLIDAARQMGSEMTDPFMGMSFMALEVIPKLKLTDVGLVDVEKFEIIDLFE